MNVASADMAAVESSSVISLRGVRKLFSGRPVIDNLSFEVREGEIVTLLGRTGAGKTTVLNLIMGTLSADAGTIKVAGFDPFREFKALRGHLSVSFQTDRLLAWRTAVENVELGLLILGVDRKTARSRAAEWLARVNLGQVLNKYPHELSGGMRQRVSLARALAVDPRLVLLDESFSQLDHVTSRNLRRDFCAVAQDYHKTCLMVTHRIEDALEMADRVIVLGAGAEIVLEMPLAGARGDVAASDACRAQIEAALGADHNGAE